MKRRYDCHEMCSVEMALELIGGKWKALILFHLLKEKKRFNELKRLMPSITQRMLTRQLREMENDKLIIRTVYPVVPPKVEYEMSDLGLSLENVLYELRDWGRKHAKSVLESSESKVKIDEQFRVCVFPKLLEGSTNENLTTEPFFLICKVIVTRSESPPEYPFICE